MVSASDPPMEIILSKPKFLMCLVTHVSATENKVEVWCQTDVQNAGRLEALLDSNHIHLSDSFAIASHNLRPVTVPEVGRSCLTHMKGDLHFHRAIVTHVNPIDGMALVLFIDFGNEEWKPFNHLVQMESLFQIEPLAQKYFLADIRPKNEWDVEQVKRCLRPYLMETFHAEVIGISQNTECLRIYSKNFEQPLITSLVKYCNGLLQYPSRPKEVFEAIDLTTSKRTLENNKPESSFAKEDRSADKEQQYEPNFTNSEPNKEVEENKENLKPLLPMTNGFVADDPQKLKQWLSYEYNGDTKDQDLPPVSNGSPNGPNEMSNKNQSFGGDHPEVEVEPYGDQKSGIDLNDVKNETTNVETEAQINAQKGIGNDAESPISDESQEPINEESVDQMNCGAAPEEPIGGCQEVVKESIDSCNKNSCVDETPSDSNLKSEITVTLVGDEFKLVNHRISIYLSASKSDSIFYCQMASKFVEISAITDKMTEFYDKIYQTDEHAVKSVELGQWVAARYSSDKLWYRAAVTAVNGDQLQVFYLDYGNTESVNISECKLLTPLYNEKAMRPQAIQCSVGDHKIAIQTMEEYIMNVTELVVDFLDFKDGLYSVKVIEIKQ